LLLLHGIGPQAARRIIASLGVRADAGASMGSSPLRKLLQTPPSVPSGAATQFEELRTTIRDCLGVSVAAAQPIVSHGGDTIGWRGGRDPALPTDVPPAAPVATGGGRYDEQPDELPLGAQIERIRRFYDPIFKDRYD